jgi:PAS domain S-box-containing protein
MDIKLLNSLEIVLPLMPGYAYWKDKQGVYLGCNELFASAAGLSSRQEIIGKTDLDLPWKDVDEDIKKTDLDVLLTGKNQSIEGYFTLADGSELILLCNKTAIKDQNGNIQGILGTASDITANKRYQAELQTNQDQTKLALENILDNIPAHIFWKDRNCILLGCNNLQAKTLGFASQREMIGKTTYELMWSNQPNHIRSLQAEALTKIDLEVMDTGKDYVVEEPLVLSDGSTAIYLSRKTPLRSEGEIVGLLGIAFDITALKKTEQELQETRHKLEGMTLVGASIAHEIRTPLATIAVGAGSFGRYIPPLVDTYKMALAANLPAPELDLRLLEQLKILPQSLITEANAGNIFIDMLLQNIRPKLDGSPVQTFTVSACVKEALERYPFIGDQRGLVIWNKAHDFVIRGKEDKLIVHVLFNLIKNALFYVADAGKGNIQIWLEPGNPYNKLIFKDTGKGIVPDILPHVFDRFFSKTHNGAGVGLTYCKMVMENLGGSITCESVLGDYTQFILNFPTIDAT